MAGWAAGCIMGLQNDCQNPYRETPFKLAYGSETVIPAEVHMANHKVTMYQDKDNEEQLRLNLDRHRRGKDGRRGNNGKVQKSHG